MKITATRLKRIIKEELEMFLEQAPAPDDISLSDEAKKKATETAAKVKASDAMDSDTRTSAERRSGG